jgi:hypothetical protein
LKSKFNALAIQHPTWSMFLSFGIHADEIDRQFLVFPESESSGDLFTIQRQGCDEGDILFPPSFQE